MTLRIVILAAVLANIGLTLWFNLKPGSAPAPVAETIQPLPDALNQRERNKIAEELLAAFNSDDHGKAYDLFGPIARIQLSREDIAASVASLKSAFVSIEEAEFYDYSVPSKTNLGTQFDLYYHVRFAPGGAYSKGSMRVSTYYDGENIQLLGFHINGAQ